MSEKKDDINKDLLMKYLEDIKTDIATIKTNQEAQSEKTNAVNLSVVTLATNLENHIKLEETVKDVKKEANNNKTAYLTIIGLLIILITFLAGYKIADDNNNNKYYDKQTIRKNESKGNSGQN